MTIELSKFAQTLTEESAFTVLALAKSLQAAGKDVIELEIGDSPFEPPSAATRVGLQAMHDNVGRYCASLGLPPFRQAAAEFVQREFNIEATADNIAVAPGAKPFEQYFCEAFLNPGDGVLVFSPHFPTYPPNIARRAARMVVKPLTLANAFRPQMSDVEDFLTNDPQPKAIFLNTPHNPTGGVMTEEDCIALAERLRGTNIVVFSDEPYCHMTWNARHHSLAAQPGMLERTVAAYTFSKSYSMSGWRLGFCVAAPEVINSIGLMINSTVSCTPPLVQLAGAAVLEESSAERDEAMQAFRRKVELLTTGLNQIDGFTAIEPTGTFYVFPHVQPVCDRLKLTSHELALYLLEGADDRLGVACLGGECFGDAGAGYLRFSCAEPDDRLQKAVDFIATAIRQEDKVATWKAGRS